jgi:hypothetical protein
MIGYWECTELLTLGASTEISSDSGAGSYQTLPKTNRVDDDDTNDTPSFRGGVVEIEGLILQMTDSQPYITSTLLLEMC